MISGWNLLTDRLWIHYTWGDLSSYYLIILSSSLSVRPIANTKELISCHAYRLDSLQSDLSSGSIWATEGVASIELSQSELSSRSVLELKGLHQWTYAYSELLSSHRLQCVLVCSKFDWLSFSSFHLPGMLTHYSWFNCF